MIFILHLLTPGPVLIRAFFLFDRLDFYL